MAEEASMDDPPSPVRWERPRPTTEDFAMSDDLAFQVAQAED